MDITILFFADKLVSLRHISNLVFCISLFTTVMLWLVCMTPDVNIKQVSDTVDETKYKIDQLIEFISARGQNKNEAKPVAVDTMLSKIDIMLSEINFSLGLYGEYVDNTNKHFKWLVTSLIVMAASAFLSFILPDDELAIKIVETLMK